MCGTERNGTLIEVYVGNYRAEPLVHHSVAFDGYEHTTACGLTIPCKNIENVKMDVPTDLDSVENICNGCLADTGTDQNDLHPEAGGGSR